MFQQSFRNLNSGLKDFWQTQILIVVVVLTNRFSLKGF
jgi:hypothetical protein